MKTLYSILVFFIGLCLYSQNKVSGIVVDQSNTPLPGATIQWENTTTATTSEADGSFEISHKPEGTLLFSYVGHKSKKLKETDTLNTLRIILHAESILDELVVQSKRKNSTSMATKTTNTTSMNSGELLKAACCNVAEAFETNPSIDVSFTDAITGTKQIKLLGLSSPYILITEENIPTVRGASQSYGLSFTPGSWVESIQVTKGAGTVTNGFESISGQINTELIKPSEDIPLFINLYGSTDSRLEANIQTSHKITDKISTSLYIHGNLKNSKQDSNKDGFLDMPLAEQINLMNRWQYTNTEKGLISFLTLRYMDDSKQMGQLDFNSKTDKLKPTYWGAEVKTRKMDLNSKFGYVFPELPFQNIGVQVAYNYHNQDSYFGLNPYQIKQNSVFTNLIFNSIISNTKNNFSTGLSFTHDSYDEFISFSINKNFNRVDQSIGGFFEYSYNNSENLSLIAGLRIDHHNSMGTFLTPRFHLKYNPAPLTTIRFSAGRGKRIANIFAENQSLLASNRGLIIHKDTEQIYGLDPEIAWNYGFSILQKFDLLSKPASIGLDIYRTDFKNQILIDRDLNSHEVHFYNLVGESFANSLQVDFNYALFQNFNLRAAYKHYDIQADYKTARRQTPLQAKHRVFTNLEYETKQNIHGKKWKFDATYNWVSKQRIPGTLNNQPTNQLPEYSNPFSMLNAQVTKVFSDSFEVYMGAENITNYKQDKTILSYDQPFSADFDSSLIYGPILGQTYYVGLRFKIN